MFCAITVTGVVIAVESVTGDWCVELESGV